MKNILVICAALVPTMLFAGPGGLTSPTISSGGGGMNSNAVYNLIQTTAPTNGGLNALQVGTQVNGSNYSTATQVSVQVAGGAIVQTNGTGTNTTLGSLTDINGTITESRLASGVIERTNSAGFNDWFVQGTNGVWTWGTGVVAKVTLDRLGNMTFPSANGGIVTAKQFTAVQNIFAGNGIFEVSQFGFMSDTALAAGTGLSNIITIDASGNFNTNDYQIWYNSISNSAVAQLPKRTNYLAYDWANFLSTTNVGNAIVIDGVDAFGSIQFKGTNWPTGGGSTPNGLITNSSPLIILTTNSGIMASNTVNHYAFYTDTNITAHWNTNGGDAITAGTNGLFINTGPSNYFGGVNYMQSNAAPFLTSDNPTNQYLVNTLYTVGNYRGFLVGEVMLLYTTTQIPAINLNVTNGGFGYTLFYQHNQNAVGSSGQDWYSFCIPLSPGATFKFVNLVPAGTLAYPTNTTFWVD